MGRWLCEPYECVSCGYNTKCRNDMKRHLYDRKKHCNRSKNNITLSEEIKQHILENRRYEIPASNENKNTINNVINTYNCWNNFISKMPLQDKIEKLISYTQLGHIGYEDVIRSKYENDAKDYDDPRNMSIETAAIDKNRLFTYIDEVTKSEPESNDIKVNVIYDHITKKIKMFQDGVWDNHLTHIGVNKLFEALQSILLDAYERFLINKYTSSKTHFADKARVKELFQEYYKFLGYFDLQPFVSRITPFEQRHYDPDGIFYSWYNDATDNITKSECKEHQKIVTDVLKGNSKQSIDDLNKKIFDLMKMDETFRNQIIGKNMYSTPLYANPLCIV